ncbi:MAG TPA: gliding motility-associated protein GldE [Bacteroidales bacterium]|nr:gliding motility-associated protein GldE [Bacteroidales bacterium]HQB21233.1 gliding motility-associated protein GldE [Bacteroidales bacterium]
MDSEPFINSIILLNATFDTKVVVIEAIAIVILLFCSGMISASEVAFFSLSAKDLHKLKKSSPKSFSRIVRQLEKPNWLLSTILIANNFVNISIIILSTYLTQFLFTGMDTNSVVYILLQLVLVTFLILLFGEIMPKILAAKVPIKAAKAMSLPLLIIGVIFYPISYLLIKSTNFINKRLEKRHKNKISIEELSHVIELAGEDLKEDKEMLEGIVNSINLSAKEIMTSRIDVFALDYNLTFSEVVEGIVNSGFSRIPVYVENLDNIKGVLYIKDVLPYIYLQNKDEFKWQKLIKPHFIVPESKNINDLLKNFQDKKLHIAIVVDEYGGVSGLVTLEDVLEEFVGEITDESDEDEETLFEKIDDKTYVFDAKISLVDFCKIIDVDYSIFNEIKGDSDSLAGLILEVNGEIPKQNKVLEIAGFLFTIIDSDKRKIIKIKTKLPDEVI